MSMEDRDPNRLIDHRRNASRRKIRQVIVVRRVLLGVAAFAVLALAALLLLVILALRGT